ncbi:MAG: DUF4917 family protein [Bacteroidales bacterium]
MVELLSFEDALEVAGEGKRHLLLGNGFSISLKPDIFTYGALYDNADFSGIPYAEELFEALDTRDFEAVIRVLVDMARLLSVYKAASPALIHQIEEDANKIKAILVEAIASGHPDRPYDISDDQYIACRAFLAHFVGGKIYTLNYDVLLYWALMHDDVDDLDLRPDDGFRSDEDDPDAPYVTWQEAHKPTVYYLHGALHLFDAGYQLQKYTWSRTDLPIIDQIREALDANLYPLFVSEGHTHAKLAKIMHSAYLHKGLRSLESVTGSLFVFGHSLAENDDHILRLIETGKISKLFVSIYGDPTAKANKAIIQRAKAMTKARQMHSGHRYPLDVFFYDAESAHVWG